MENFNLKKCNVPFGIVSNELLNNKAISMKAKGLFAFMQSKPEGWDFSIKMISGQTKDGIDSVSEGLKELELFGYLERKKVQTGNGFSTEYYLFFESTLIDSNLGKSNLGKSNLGKSNLGKSNLGKSNLGKSNHNSNKEYSNKELSKKEEREETALAFFEENYPSEYEILMMQFKKQINDFVKFGQMFNATVEQERLEYDKSVLSGRFKKYAFNWITNQNKFDSPVIELNPNQKKEKIGGF
jgi:hypothetical protein